MVNVSSPPRPLLRIPYSASVPPPSFAPPPHPWASLFVSPAFVSRRSLRGSCFPSPVSVLRLGLPTPFPVFASVGTTSLPLVGSTCVVARRRHVYFFPFVFIRLPYSLFRCVVGLPLSPSPCFVCRFPSPGMFKKLVLDNQWFPMLKRWVSNLNLSPTNGLWPFL